MSHGEGYILKKKKEKKRKKKESILNFPEFMEESKIIKVRKSSKVNNPTKAMMFNMLQSHIPLMIHFRFRIRKILFKNQMSIHNPRLPHYLRHITPFSLRLHHNPQQWLPNKPYRIPQSPQPYFSIPIATPRRSHDDDLSSRRHHLLH